MQIKKIPMRRCIACREMKPKKELIRIVKDTDGSVKVDITGKVSGRGAYICSNKECLQKVKKKDLLKNELETTIDNQVYDDILRIIESEH